MLFNQNFYTYYCKKKQHLNILIFHRYTRGGTRLLGHDTVV